MRNKARILGLIAIVLAAMQVLLIIVTWIVSAAMPEVHMRSLLGNEGIRWFFGHFAENLCNVVLIWLALLCVGGGSVLYSGLWASVRRLLNRQALRYFERVGLYVVLVELIIFIVALLLLTMVPHAILLSVTGHLFPSSFSHSLAPVVSFVMLVCSLSFGVVSGKLNSLAQLYKSMTYGMGLFAWIFPLYVLASELFYSVLFVFG